LEFNGKYKITQPGRSQEGEARSAQEGDSEAQAHCSTRFRKTQDEEDGARYSEEVEEQQ
jgi:hypothetical protein